MTRVLLCGIRIIRPNLKGDMDSEVMKRKGTTSNDPSITLTLGENSKGRGKEKLKPVSEQPRSRARKPRPYRKLVRGW